MTGRLAEQPSAVRAEQVERKTNVTRRGFLLGSGAVAAGMAFYSGEIARHEISVVTRPIAINNLPAAFQNFRIVQISDIHYEEYAEPSFVARVIGQVNALAPDLVVLTGDYVSFGPLGRSFALGAMERCAEQLSHVACARRYAVMGNHDSVLGAPTIRPILAAVDIPLLVNEHVPIERGGERLWLSGIHDPVTHVPNLETAIPERPDGPVLLMSHGPDYADEVLVHPRGRLVDLMISGHTHGGQVRIPFVPPVHLPEGGRKYIEGLFRFGRMQLYVNRGIGTTGLPLRLNCPPEITLMTLQSS
jgi:predicted MPP superfamily phosphohydrolase